MHTTNKRCKMCVLKTIYITAASVLISVLLLSFTQTSYTKHYAITSKNVKLNKTNKINTYENGALIKGGKIYIRTDIIEEINPECEIKNQYKYILIKESA